MHHNQAIAVLGRPTYVDFPGLGDTPFGDVVPEGSTASACEALRGHFEKKEALKARANFLLYQVKQATVIGMKHHSGLQGGKV